MPTSPLTTENQNPEQRARDTIDTLLNQAGWVVQNAREIDLNAGLGQAVREYQTDVGPADYVLFVDKKAVGVIEAKKEDLAHKITEVESQTAGYAAAKLKWINNKEPLPFLYESTGIITRFTDGRDPRPRSREVFNFHRPETLKEWLSQGDSLGGLADTPSILYQRVGKFVPHSEDVTNLIYWYLRSSDFIQALKKELRGVNIPFINQTRLMEYPVPLCDFDELIQIVAELESSFSVVDQLDQTITTALQQAEALRQSILKKAFAGRLVPQDPHDEPASALLARIQAERADVAVKPRKTAKDKT